MEKRGRPTVYTPELAEEICERLANGESLRAICDDDDDMPSEVTVRRWVLEDRNRFSAQYTLARQVQAMRWADELIDIADDGTNDYVMTRKGPQFSKEAAMRSRLRLDTRKWLLSKMLPKVYGDKAPTDSDGNDVPVVHFSRTQK